MDENGRADDGATRMTDEDVVQLLNTKKEKSREILSITNAAADAVASHAQTQKKRPFVENYSSQNYVENKENNVSVSNISDSFVSKDGSFCGQQRVRIPSRLLREIKSPLERSSSENVSTSASRNTSSGSLFASQSSSENSSIQATGPVPTVIKYSLQPSIQAQPESNPGQTNSKQQNDTPVVIKYLQEYVSPNSKDLSLSSEKSVKSELKVSDSNTGVNPQEKSSISVEKHSRDERKVIVSERKNLVSKESSLINNPGSQENKELGQYTDIPVKMKGVGLCQGAPSHNLSHITESERGQVKAVSFTMSEKGKATRDMLTKRQEHCPAVRKIVQAKIVDEKPSNEVQDLKNRKDERPSKGPSTTQDKEDHPVVQVPRQLEEQMKSLMHTLGTIENQCQENRVWQEKQQEELERSIKERDERRLQHLEEMQKQLVEYQLRYAQPITAPTHQAYTSAIGNNTTQGLSSTQVNPAVAIQPAVPQSSLQAPSSQNLVVQGVSNPEYAPAVEHQTQSSFRTTVYSKTREEIANSGVNRKFVRNTRTQTSPQYSSSLSSSETSSPLDTPLPRKRHPVPMTRDWKADRGKKHVHFDTPGDSKSEKFLKKKKGEPYPVVRNFEVQDHKLDEAQKLQPYQHYVRPRTSAAPTSPESAHIVNDISRLRQELRDALNETEQTKLSLKNLDDRIHSQISSDESIVALPDHTRPYPLDAYLRATRDVPEELSTSKLEEDSQTVSKPEVTDTGSGLCTYALSVLRDVQKQKENLDWNLLALSRRHDEQYLYDVAEDDETSGEALRIRKDVAKKIEEIDADVKAELLHEEQQRALENQVTVERSKPAKQGPRSTHGVPFSTEKRAKLRSAGKESTQARGKTTAKPKTTKPAPKPTAVKRPLEDATYVSRVYGRNDHATRGTTLKPVQARYQAPTEVDLKRSNRVSRHKALSPPRLDESSSTLSEDYRRPSTHRRATTRNPRYFFQPNAGADQSVIEAHFKGNQGPLPGQLLPMAIPLGKPRMDPALRLPLRISEDESGRPETVTVSSDVKQPNVAVITLKDEECLQHSVSSKKQKKSVAKKREGMTLEKQVLPSVDIDTSAVSDVTSDVSAKEIRVDEPTILPIPDPLPRPGASEYEEFKEYENVTTVRDDGDSEKSSLQGEENMISLHGESRADNPAYQGPAFPPRNIPMDVQDHDGFQGTLGDLRTPSETVEHKARELIEQELLARVVSEIAPGPRDPTSVVRRSRSSESLVDGSDSEPDIAAAIGLRGVQLFVDAGIPVDTELVRNLIMDVLQEKVTSMLGYPRPQEKNILLATQEPKDDYTEPESGSEDYSRVQTPVRTPSAASQPESRPLSHVSTPEQTQSPDSLSSSTPDDVIDTNANVATSGHVMKDAHSDEIEEGLLDDSVHKSPIATPIATPSPPQSIMSLHTPDVSEKEKTESDQKPPVETPEITVSIRETTPSESPKQVEDDLKEQTLVEDEEETGADIPVIKFELKPEPSEAKVTNSPSSITTTTYSTHSTMGTVASDDEISEGEQLQPYVHVGQYSEGEFVPPSGIAGNMTTLHEIPDDIFDAFNTTNKKRDPVKQAFNGLLKLDDVSDESSRVSEENTSSEGQQRLPPAGSLAQSVVQDDHSEGEVVGAGDVVATLLTRIRQSVWRRRPPAAPDMQDTASVGEIDESAAQPFLQRLPRPRPGEGDLSPGEFASPDHNRVKVEPLPMQTLDRAQTSSILDSDENNNDSQQSSSLNEVLVETWDKNDMVTPKKATVPFKQDQLHYSEQSPPASSELNATFPRVVHVAEAGHVSRQIEFSSSPVQPSGLGENVTMETLSEISRASHVSHHVNDPVSDHMSDHVSDHVSEHASDHMMPKHVLDQPARIQLTLPSAEPGVSMISEGLLGSDESAAEISSISGGEIY